MCMGCGKEIEYVVDSSQKCPHCGAVYGRDKKM